MQRKEPPIYFRRAALVLFCPLPLKPIEIHAKAEPHIRQNFFDLIQRFPTKIPSFEHFWLIFLDEFTYGLDIGVLQTVVGAY